MNQKDNITKRKKWEYIKEKERYKIEVLLKEKYTTKEIAESLGRDRRTIEREIEKGTIVKIIENPYMSRNPNVPDYLEIPFYSAKAAQERYDKKKLFKGRYPKAMNSKDLLEHIEKKIIEHNYSPDAVIGEIKEQGLKFSVTVCTKTVYNMIDRGDFYNLTNKNLPLKRDKPKRKYRHIGKVAKNNLKGQSIEKRPEIINSREEKGHWEMDSVVGKGKSSLLVLTERKVRKEIIIKLARKTQEEVIKALDNLERIYGQDFKTIFKSITMDNGSEFLDFNGIQASCLKEGEKRIECYYAHPYSSWERGSNENANRLIRRFIPKGKNIDKYSEQQIKEIETWMNNYPRRMFGYKTANQMYYSIS